MSKKRKKIGVLGLFIMVLLIFSFFYLKSNLKFQEAGEEKNTEDNLDNGFRGHNNNNINITKNNRIQKYLNYLVNISIVDKKKSLSSVVSTSLGQGFLLNNDGYILTNKHVVKKINEYSGVLLVYYQDGEKIQENEVENVRWDDKHDLAILKIGKALPFFVSPVFQETPLIKGEASVISKKNQKRIKKGMVNFFNLSGENHGQYQKMGEYHTNIRGDLGDSGSILIDKFGRVIGLNTMINLAEGNVLYSIPITNSLINSMLNSVLKKGKLEV